MFLENSNLFFGETTIFFSLWPNLKYRRRCYRNDLPDLLVAVDTVADIVVELKSENKMDYMVDEVEMK